MMHHRRVIIIIIIILSLSSSFCAWCVLCITLFIFTICYSLLEVKRPHPSGFFFVVVVVDEL